MTSVEVEVLVCRAERPWIEGRRNTLGTSADTYGRRRQELLQTQSQFLFSVIDPWATVDHTLFWKRKYPKCVPQAKANRMSESQKRSAVTRKRAKAQGVGGKPTNVKTFASKGMLIETYYKGIL